MVLLNEIRHKIFMQCHRNSIVVEKKSIICLKLPFLKITYRKIWVFWGVIFEGLSVQMKPRRPAGWDYPVGLLLAEWWVASERHCHMWMSYTLNKQILLQAADIAIWLLRQKTSSLINLLILKSSASPIIAWEFPKIELSESMIFLKITLELGMM